jgi:hypothetical protein
LRVGWKVGRADERIGLEGLESQRGSMGDGWRGGGMDGLMDAVWVHGFRWRAATETCRMVVSTCRPEIHRRPSSSRPYRGRISDTVPPASTSGLYFFLTGLKLCFSFVFDPGAISNIETLQERSGGHHWQRVTPSKRYSGKYLAASVNIGARMRQCTVLSLRERQEVRQCIISIRCIST